MPRCPSLLLNRGTTEARTFCRCRNAACARRLTSARGAEGSRPPLPPAGSRRGAALPLAADDSRSTIAYGRRHFFCFTGGRGVHDRAKLQQST